jgi:O-antigen/teichoic acid export membrane protein
MNKFLFEWPKNVLQSQGFRRYSANTIWLISERIIRIVLSLIVGIYVARYLGPEKFGLFSYAISFVGLFSALSALGLDGIIVRDLINSPDKDKALLGTAFVLKIIGAFVALCAIGLAILFTSNDFYTNTLIFIIAAGLIFKSFEVVIFCFQAEIISKYTAISQSAALIIVSMAKLLFIFLNLSLVYFALMALVEGLLLSVGLIFFYVKKQKSPFNWTVDQTLAKYLLRQSWPFIFSAIIVSLYMRIDQVMLKEMMGSEVLGNYAAAVKLAELWYFLPVIMSSSLFPAIASARNNDYALYLHRLLRIYSLLTWISITIAFPVSIFAKPIVSFLYGEQYLQAAKVLSIYIWAGIFVSFGTAKGSWTVLESQQKYTLGFQVIGTSANILLNIIWIPIYGAIGAAMATMATVVLNTLITPVVLNKKQRSQTILFIRSFNPRYIFESR